MTKFKTKRGKRRLRQRLVKPWFGGPSRETAIHSVERIMDVYPVSPANYQLKEEIGKNIYSFLSEFYHHLENELRMDPEYVDSCKRRFKELKRFQGLIATLGDCPEEFYVITRRFTNPRATCLENLLWFPNKPFSISYLTEDDEVVDLYYCETKPSIYRHLFRAMAMILRSLERFPDSSYPEFLELKSLSNVILSFAGIFNEYNQDALGYRKYEDDLLAILEHEERTLRPELKLEDNRIDDPVYWRTLFYSVCQDIQEGRLPYVQEVSRAITRGWEFAHSPYTEDDLYLSMKACTSKHPVLKSKASLIHASVEPDPYRGCPFDECVGYTSHYNQDTDSNLSWSCFLTQLIDNNGKPKPRAIHIALNAIQDRCRYIGNRLARINSFIWNDCTKEQEAGHRFLRKVTLPHWREKRGWPTIACMDWSNATDKLSQEFQCDCLRLIFPEPVVEFWSTISMAEKTLIRKDGTRRTYIQRAGQPQGLLGSFNAFAFAHHILMLMTMKASGLENANPREFYVILGDDSVICSINCDPHHRVVDNYVQACAFANLDIELSKSTIVDRFQQIAMADFAKVTVLNGEFFSPVPTRLALRCGRANEDFYYVAALLWLGKYDVDTSAQLRAHVDTLYPDDPVRQQAARLLYFGDISHRFANYADPLMDRSLEYLVKFSYLVAKIRFSVAETLLGDKVREDLSLHAYSIPDAIESLLPDSTEEILDLIEDPENKLMVQLEKNLQVEDALKGILGVQKDTSVVGASLRLSEEETRLLVDVADIGEMMDLGLIPDSDNALRQSIDSALRGVKNLDRFNMRSVYKANAVETIVFNEAINLCEQLYRILGVSMSNET